ncbi:MAG: helix-turn-helix domain-containing protein [Pseudomonadota bacterium]
MTPFGERLRALRAEKGITQRQFASAVGVSAGYLSALEHGHRGKPSWPLLQRIVGELGVIWDEAEDLQRLAHLSDTRVVVDTTTASAAATLAANLLAERIAGLDEDSVSALLALLTANSSD